MNRTCSLFSQILSIVDRRVFASLVDKHASDRGSKGFKSWDQLGSMLFCQLAQAKSLREIEGGLKCCEGKLAHLGVGSAPKRSTLSYANEHRPWELYRDLFYELLGRCRKEAPGHRFRFKNKLLSLDATVITLCSSMFDWAKYRASKGAIKLHMLLDHDGYIPTFAHITEGSRHEMTVAKSLSLPKGSIVAMDKAYVDYGLFERWSEQGVYFVTRLKRNAFHVSYDPKPIPPTKTHILSDEELALQPLYGSYDRKCKRPLRLVRVYNAENDEVLELVTNIRHLSADTISEIYKERWQIELFFKALKQNLRIKTFVGTSSNAVHVQVWTALIAILLLKYLKMRSKAGWALSNLVALLRWNLFTYRDLWAWIDKPFDTPQVAPQYSQMELVLDSS
jgi:hypothetical protein